MIYRDKGSIRTRAAKRRRTTPDLGTNHGLQSISPESILVKKFKYSADSHRSLLNSLLQKWWKSKARVSESSRLKPVGDAWRQRHHPLVDKIINENLDCPGVDDLRAG
jgi:hypothetical protein